MTNVYEPVPGLRYWADNSLERYRADSLFTKEPETVAWINDQFTGPGMFLDVGANVGTYACYAGWRNPEGRVLAFEPFRPNFIRLSENVELNKLSNVVPLHLALSNVSGVQPLFILDTRTGGSGSQIGEGLDERGQAFEPLAVQPTLVFTVDGFLAATGLGCPQHIKIDVDGKEGPIVYGMSLTLSDPGLRSLLIELNTDSTATKGLVSFIESHGFTRDNHFNSLEQHSRNRRKAALGNVAENVVFTRKLHTD